MPFPIVHRVPDDLSRESLQELDRKLRDVTAREMGIDPGLVHPDYTFDRLMTDPFIYFHLDTAMFASGSVDDIRERNTILAIASTIYNHFYQEIPVEGGPSDLNKDRLVKLKPPTSPLPKGVGWPTLLQRTIELGLPAYEVDSKEVDSVKLRIFLVGGKTYRWNDAEEARIDLNELLDSTRIMRREGS